MADGFEYININHAVMIWHKDCYMVIWILIALFLNENAPVELQQLVVEGLDAMKKVFVW